MRERLIIAAVGLMAVGAFVLSEAAGTTLPQAALATVTFALLMAGYLGPADRRAAGYLEAWLKGNRVRVWAFGLVLWLFASTYGWLSGQWNLTDSLYLLVYIAVPVALLLWDRKPGPVRLSVALSLAVLCVWLPIEWSLLPALHLPAGGRLQLDQFFAVVLALFLFRLVRGLDGMGYTFVLSRTDWKTAARHFSLFLAFFALPLGITLKFVIATGPAGQPFVWPLQALFILLFIAIPEEILFRGVIQNLLERQLSGAPWLSLSLASLIFGFSHANNKVPPIVPLWVPGLGVIEFPWVYVLLATIAGVFYGLTYRKTGKLTAAAVVHCLVDLWWALFFTSP